jgi:hypothetical protein
MEKPIWMAVIALMFLGAVPAGADQTAVDDPNDSDGPDLVRVIATHQQLGWLNDSPVLAYKLDFDQPISPPAFNETLVVVQLDQDRDGRAERRIWIRPQSQGSLQAAVISAGEKLVGYANAFVYDGDQNQMWVSFPRTLLKWGERAYRWRVLLIDQAVERPQCGGVRICDAVPDEGWTVHR